MNLGGFLAGLVVLSALFSGDDGLKTPACSWTDDVGEDISKKANKAIGRFNAALKAYREKLSEIDRNADALVETFDSQESNISWLEGKSDAIKVDRIKEEVERIMKG